MKKPIALVLTDTHLNKENHDEVFDIFEQAFNLASELGVKNVFHAGDVFTNRVGQNLKTLITFKRILNIFEGTSINLTAIPGNHDKTDQSSPDSYLDVFEHTKNFKIVREIQGILLEGVKIHFLGFFTNDEYLKRLSVIEEHLQKDGENILITHIAFNGVKNNDGSEVEDSIKPKSVKGFDKVLVGHYHDASKISKNIHYIGSAYQANYGENITDKGFTIINSDASLDFEPSEFKKYVKVKIDLNGDYENEIEMYEDSEDNIRFIFEGSKDQIHKIDLDKMSSKGIDCKFEIVEINKEILNSESDSHSVMDKKAVLDYFKEYSDLQGFSKKQTIKGIRHLS